jgi:hypothetical protein
VGDTAAAKVCANTQAKAKAQAKAQRYDFEPQHHIIA